MEFIISTLTENQYFSAGFGLFGVGALAAAGKKLTSAGLVLFRRHCITTLGMKKIWQDICICINDVVCFSIFKLHVYDIF